MLPTNQEGSKHQHTLVNCSKCVDTNFSTLYSDNWNKSHLPRGNNKIYHSTETHPHLANTTSLQHYITTSQHFHLPPWYELPAFTVNISLDIANPNMVNISSLDFHMWHHLEDHRNETQLHHLSSIPSVPITQLYKHMISGAKPITPFWSPTESIDDTASIWTLFSHTGVYVMAIGSIIPAGLGIFCCYFFWSQPARLVCQPLQPVSMEYTIMDDDVEVTPFYRCNSKAKQPTRPHMNHDLHMEQEPMWMESWQEQQIQSSGVPACGSLDTASKIQGTW